MVRASPTTAQACFDEAGRFFRARRIEETLANLNEAEHLGFSPDECAAARWECWMLLGRFDRAWAESDLIAGRDSPDPHRFWDGQPFDGKRVIIRCLHGLGDTIQFIRYAPMIRRVAQRVIVECPPELVRLIQRVDGVDDVISWGDGTPAIAPGWDSQVEINELPRVFHATEKTIPRVVPYIKVTRPSVGSRPNKRVGLVWNSSQWNPARSVSLELLLDSLGGADWDLVSLQFGCDQDRLPSLCPDRSDVLDTAVHMLSLDLVVTVDTMTAHLAGALSLPVWVILPFEADWRWMLNRSDSPWYPTMRLFRQQAQGDWPSALEQLSRAALAF